MTGRAFEIVEVLVSVEGSVDQPFAAGRDQSVCGFRTDPADHTVERVRDVERIARRNFQRDRSPLWKPGVVDELGVRVRDLGRRVELLIRG